MLALKTHSLVNVWDWTRLDFIDRLEVHGNDLSASYNGDAWRVAIVQTTVDNALHRSEIINSALVEKHLIFLSFFVHNFRYCRCSIVRIVWRHCLLGFFVAFPSFKSLFFQSVAYLWESPSWSFLQKNEGYDIFVNDWRTDVQFL